ncbi:hypothetical protein IT402_02990 [Candidatus Nomurabacteria bacterium]|nr:hypothetical protein [Candidatus Nomurabacteria bacterium]
MITDIKTNPTHESLKVLEVRSKALSTSTNILSQTLVDKQKELEKLAQRVLSYFKNILGKEDAFLALIQRTDIVFDDEYEDKEFSFLKIFIDCVSKVNSGTQKMIKLRLSDGAEGIITESKLKAILDELGSSNIVVIPEKVFNLYLEIYA